MKHVLIIEDDRWQGEIFRDILEADNFTVTVCGYGQQAIEALDEKLPHAIVLDLLLPQANGVAFLHEIKSYLDSATIPVIICTASGLTSSLRQSLMQYGVTAILDKTELEPKQLVEIINQVS